MTDAWKQNPNAVLYLPALAAAELAHGIPTDLLARVAYQESHWRPDIVSGAMKSPAGCVGLMQLNPRYFPGAGVSWQADIETAGKYLAALTSQFHGDWHLGIMAYNWGPGNVAKYVANDWDIDDLPIETRNYIIAVFDDVPMDGTVLNA